MGIMKKMTFSSKKPSSSETASVEATDPALDIPRDVLKTHAPMSTVSDDTSTRFTTFMTIFYGFYAVTLTVYPQIHVVSSYNPMAYWTELSDEMCFAFRLLGTTIFVLCFGPYMDETFGGPGVKMAAFTRMMGLATMFGFVVFLYYSFYAPLDTAVAFMWQGQTAFFALLLGWAITECISVETLVSFYAKYNTALYSFFGVGLVAAPDVLFGTPSPFAYWSVWGDLSLFAGRGLGIALLGLVSVGYYYSGAKMCKLYTAFNLINFGLFTMPSFFPGESAVVSMWMIQLLITVPVVYVGLYMELIGATGPWKVSVAVPSIGLSLNFFNFFQVIFFVPFIVGFYTNPNLVFGPANPVGFPMFLLEFNETSTWFCRAWATNVLMLMLAPYTFGLAALPVAKMWVVSYVGNASLFTYALFFTSMMNMIVVAPLFALQLGFIAWGVYVILPAQNGGTSLV